MLGESARTNVQAKPPPVSPISASSMIVAGLLLLGAGAARAELPLTEAEAAWLRDHPSVTVGMDSAFAPINHLDAAGRPAGSAVDMLRLIEAKSGLSIDRSEEHTAELQSTQR